VPGILFQLLQNPEPLVRYKARLLLPASDQVYLPALSQARDEARKSPLVEKLLAERGADGCIPHNAYFKWSGPHWVLYTLAELGFPPGDDSLQPLLQQDMEWLLSDQRLGWVKKRTRLAGGSPPRACASMEGATIFSMLKLGLVDERITALVERLLEWQWPDGGWNCDANPAAGISSFHETLLPFRALNLYARVSGDPRTAQAVGRAAEVFLRRRLFRRLSDDSVIDPSFTQLHFPRFWHYDLLGGLMALTEAGRIRDARCHDGLDWLESRRLPDGGFPADVKFYHHNMQISGGSLVDYGPLGKKRANPYVTLDALYVLNAAGRLSQW
jgi:hypothetical protein